MPKDKPKVERASAIDHAIALKRKLLDMGIPEEVAERASFDKYIKKLALDISRTLTNTEENLKMSKFSLWISIFFFIISICISLIN